MPLILRAMVLAAVPLGLAAQEGAWSPRPLWSRALGEGFSSFAQAGQSVVTMYRRGNEEVIVALDRGTGRTVWEHAYPVPALKEQDLSQGPGPHAVPAVEGSLVCAAGTTGRLTCLDLENGRVRWTQELIAGLGGTPVYRGYSSTPLVHGTRVIAQVGGDGRALVAFDALTGKEAWRGGSFANTNSSPLYVDAGGRGQVIAFMVDAVAGYDANTGEPLWSHPHPQRFNDNISQPVWLADEQLLVVSSALDGGTRALRLDARGASEAWHQPRTGTYYTNIMRSGNRLLLSSGGVGPTFFTALEIGTGRVAWQSRDLLRANGVARGDRLLLRDEEGRLVVAKPGSDGIEVLRQAQVLDAGAPSAPLLLEDVVYVRDRRRAIAIRLDWSGGGRHGAETAPRAEAAIASARSSASAAMPARSNR